jgi:hypothetical protein
MKTARQKAASRIWWRMEEGGGGGGRRVGVAGSGIYVYASGDRGS